MGERPAVDARQLGYNEATIAENCKIWSGVLDTWRAPLLEYSETIDGAVQSFFRYQPPGVGTVYWLHWDTDVDVVKSQVAGLDELYWTGSGVPKIGNTDSLTAGPPYAAFDLGVPAPASAVSVIATDPLEVEASGTVAAIDPYLEIGGTIGDGEYDVTANRDPHSVQSTLDVDGLMSLVISVTMDFAQRHNYTSAVFVWVEMDPSTGSPGSGTEIFRKEVTLSLPKNTSTRNTWTTDSYPASDYSFTYAPPFGSHVFRLWTQHGFKSTNDGGTPDNRKQFASVQSASGRLLVDLGATDHGLSAGDRIQLSGVVGTGNLENLNLAPVTIIGFQTGGQIAIVDAGGITGTYSDSVPATWTQVFPDVDRQSRTYAITYVVTLDNHDIESAPSPASEFITIADGESVTLSNFPAPPDDGRPYTKIYIYRLAVGATQEEFLFVDEIDIDTWEFGPDPPADTYIDNIRGVALGRVLPSQYTSPNGVLVRWDMPPDEMIGIIELPNGLYAAFLGNELLLCEPYQPHAWPLAYRRAMKDEIVGIAAFGASIAVTTKGRPVLVTGIHPDSMSDEYVEAAYPNLSKRGMVDIGYAVVYPSLRGLVMLSQGEARVITQSLFNDNQWAALNPASFIASKYGNRYIWSYDPPDEEALPINKRGLILDPQNPSSALTRLSFGAHELWSDPGTDELYMIASLGSPEPVLGIYRWEGDPNNILGALRWKSREFMAATPTFVGVVKVDADLYPATVTLYMDGEVYDSIVVANDDLHRVRSQLGKGRKWQVEVKSITGVEAAYCASNARELRQYVGNT